MRIPRAALLVALAALLAPASAAAHASLVRTEPPTGAVLARAPAQVRVVFDDVVRVGPGVEAVRNGGGSVLAGRPRVEGRQTLVVPLRHGLGNGDYSVRWAIVSDDGHLESGVVAFAVGLGRPPPVAGLSAVASGPTADSVIARWLFFAGVLVAAGIALFTLVVRPRDTERIPAVLATAGVLAALGAAQEVHRVGLATRDGKALGASFLVSLLVASGAAAATIDRRALRPALGASLVLLVLPSLAGHALDPGLARINVVADVLHVTAAAAWVGVLVGLVLLPGSDLRGPALRRAGALALAAVVLLGITGVTRAAFELTALSQLWDTSYGRALLVKTGLLFGALVAGRLVRTRVRQRAGIELALVALLVVAVSVLVELRPGRNVSSPPSAVQTSEPAPAPPVPPAGAVVLARDAGPLGIAVALEPRRTTATILSPAGGGLSGLDVRIDGTRARACGSGCYRVDAPPQPIVAVQVAGAGATRRATFAAPAHPTPAGALVRRAGAAYRGLRSVSYAERLASSPQNALVARWTIEGPDRVEYSIAGGAQGI
ncbi:MAG: copper transport protein, partial [Gaiellaceae bacterium]|nr:copper transport protein [Gaiellaceae bacterium]